MLSDESYVNIALALDALCKAFPDEKQGFIDQVEAVDNSTVKIHALKHLTEEGERAVEELADMCSPAFEFRTRILALSEFEAMDNLPESVVFHAMDAAVHFNSRLARQGQSLLEKNWDESMQGLCDRHLKKMNLVPWQVSKWERFLTKMNTITED